MFPSTLVSRSKACFVSCVLSYIPIADCGNQPFCVSRKKKKLFTTVNLCTPPSESEHQRSFGIKTITPDTSAGLAQCDKQRSTRRSTTVAYLCNNFASNRWISSDARRRTRTRPPAPQPPRAKSRCTEPRDADRTVDPTTESVSVTNESWTVQCL